MAFTRSPEIERIANDFYPGRNATDRRHRLSRYREAQVHMIRHHFPNMDYESQERAIDTIARLKQNKYRPLI